MTTPILETERLLLRGIRKDDVHSIYECWMCDEAVSTYIHWKARNAIHETKDFVDYNSVL